MRAPRGQEGRIASLEDDCEALEEVACGGGGVPVTAAPQVSPNGAEVCHCIYLPPTKCLNGEWHKIDAHVIASFDHNNLTIVNIRISTFLLDF